MGLMFITMTVLLLGNLIGLIPDHSRVTMEGRKSIAESLAVRCAYAARDNNSAAIKKTMDAIVESNPDILSLGIRSADGRYLAQTGDHQVHWSATPGGNSTMQNWQVPIYKGKKQWGTLQIRFTPKDGVVVLGHRLSPFTLLLVFFAGVSFMSFVLFMKKSLRYLDPSSVMPNRVKYALDTLTEGVLLLDTKERIILANAVIKDKLGRTDKELMGVRASQLAWIDPDTNGPTEELPWIHAISQGETQSGMPLTINTTSHGVRTFVVNSAPVLDDKGKSRGAVVTFDDVTELEKQSFQLSRMVELLQMSKDNINRKNKELEILASRDSLTDCLNRRAFFATAEHYLAESAEKGRNIACIMVDLDLFKFINDTYGHAVGDQVLKYFAKTLQREVREDDAVCRYGGEEFCIILPNCDIENAAVIVARVRRKIAKEVGQAISQARGISVTASFGLSDLTHGAGSIDELLMQADRALYKAKEDGRNRVVFWNSDKENEFLHNAERG